MTQVGPAQAATAPGEVSSKAVPSFLEWGPIFAGAVLASALSFVLLGFGMAIGLSATSPWPGSGLPARVIASRSGHALNHEAARRLLALAT